ncbi:MAG TPA: DUF4402 domain-containing protein [Gemmatimonadales bacterium]|nr:DUF4402 domain-containing protein [Gemmatimonadales bacterium]
MSRPALAVLVSACLLAAAGRAEAQGRPLRLQGLQPLNFGDVLAGVPLHARRTDPARSGQFELRGTKDQDLMLQFALPDAMSGPGGASLRLRFDAGDAGYSATESITIQQAVDPRSPFTVRLPTNGKARLFLGGTVEPTADQRGGDYTATVTLTVAYLGV